MVDRTVSFTINGKVYTAEVPEDRKFVYRAGHWRFRLYETNTVLNGKFPIDELYFDVPLIAAYAAFCWHEEANKVYFDLVKEDKVHDRYGIEDEEDSKRYNDLIEKEVNWQIICKHCRELEEISNENSKLG